ncbi:Protein N-acetyltransferase, RimJ/RimL family [Paraoerskovia marina]|uniref:Protein N-acetyltransferase, RimJ/RimL family n=1 Tax=Paraoerskovia marina TaxID=545619 RepID=A0A1H1MTA3_9CELL|nr:GNAT family N-acetyltransferase [Paraoerskovia marina]SDR89896.1 Protein N-acetyltransferase, RimJ/RimL family [Paraoerskovia marina]
MTRDAVGSGRASGFPAWPRAERLATARYLLEPLTVEHADEMVAVLASPDLYTFTGGEPPGRGVLRERYTRQVVGCSPAGDAGWLNWLVRARGSAVGYVQATLTRPDGPDGPDGTDGAAPVTTAELAWLVSPDAQGGGVATEAASAVVDWLAGRGVEQVCAAVHPDHHASAGVARRLGLVATGVMVEGEQLWRGNLADLTGRHA